MRIVIPDTSILISGILWDGLPGSLIKGAIANRWKLYSASELIAELDRTLRKPKFIPRLALMATTPEQVIAELLPFLTMVPLSSDLHVRCIDPEDDMFLACALTASADFLVSGDAHLLSLGSIGKTSIVTIRTFLEQIDQ